MRLLFRLCAILLTLAATALGQSERRLDTTNMVVVGGGWGAGYADFQLLEDSQKGSFGRLMADQMPTIMPQPQFRALGPPAIVSVDPLPGILPATGQTVLRSLPFPIFSFNLSVPFITLSESLNRSPVPPLVHEGDLKQTLINLVLGYPLLILDDPPAWTQTQYAANMAPTLVVLQLGLGDVLEAALTGEPTLITPQNSFTADFGEVARRIRGTFAQVLVLNVPDPTDMPYFADLSHVAELYQTTPEDLQAVFDLKSGDLVTLGGLVEIGDYLRGRRTAELSPDAVLRSSVASAISAAVESYNQTIQSVAVSNGFIPYDLHGLVREVRQSGIAAGSGHLGGGYLEGFYSPDGLFPTAPAHAVLANELLKLLNLTFGENFPLIDVDSVAAGEASAELSATGISIGSGLRAPAPPAFRGRREPGRRNR